MTFSIYLIWFFIGFLTCRPFLNIFHNPIFHFFISSSTFSSAYFPYWFLNYICTWHISAGHQQQPFLNRLYKYPTWTSNAASVCFLTIYSMANDVCLWNLDYAIQNETKNHRFFIYKGRTIQIVSQIKVVNSQINENI